MENNEQPVNKIIETIEETLEERKGRDRRKPAATDTYLNPTLERRKGVDRRDGSAKEE